MEFLIGRPSPANISTGGESFGAREDLNQTTDCVPAEEDPARASATGAWGGLAACFIELSGHAEIPRRRLRPSLNDYDVMFRQIIDRAGKARATGQRLRIQIPGGSIDRSAAKGRIRHRSVQARGQNRPDPAVIEPDRRPYDRPVVG